MKGLVFPGLEAPGQYHLCMHSREGFLLVVGLSVNGEACTLFICLWSVVVKKVKEAIEDLPQCPMVGRS